MSTSTLAQPHRHAWWRRPRTIAALMVVVFFGATAESCGGSSNSADNKDKNISNDIQNKYSTNQPVPDPSGKSQLRANLIDTEKFQIEGGSSWTYFFATGKADGKPIFSCPSIGDPIPITDEVTNPEKTAGYHDDTTIGQMEPTGVFTGDSSGTNVICLAGNGQGSKVYWEGDVLSTTVELQWNDATKQLEPKPNGGVSEHKFSTGGK